MSSCANGGRDVPEWPAIYGRFVFDRGRDVPFALSSLVEEGPRRLVAIEVDGVRWSRPARRWEDDTEWMNLE